VLPRPRLRRWKQGRVADGGIAIEQEIVGTDERGRAAPPLGLGGLYVVPWVSVSYNFDGDDVVIGGQEFTRSPVTIFPTVHLGWRF